MRVEHIAIKEFSGAVMGARSATAQWTARSGMILQVRTPDELLGQGEACPLPGYSPDDYEQAAAALRSIDWDSVPEPDPGVGTDGLVERLASLDPAIPPSARFAFETAFLDLLGQRAARPIWRLLTDGTGAASAAPVCALIGDADDSDIVESARRAIGRGVAGVKLKVSGASSMDRLTRIRSLRAAIGDASLRLDANGSLPPHDAAAELAKFRDFGIEFIEEPFAFSATASLEAPAVPIALDESLQDPANWTLVEPRLKRFGCVALVLKPMALGGFSRCIAWARRAADRGVEVVLSHLFDGPIALTACAHMALAFGSRRYGSGLDAHGGLGAWPGTLLPLHAGGAIVEAERAGLGVAPLVGEGR